MSTRQIVVIYLDLKIDQNDLVCTHLALVIDQKHLAWVRLELATAVEILKPDQFGSLTVPSEPKRGDFGLWPVTNGYKLNYFWTI